MYNNKISRDSKSCTPRYATRKLKIGMVSLILGFTFVCGSVSINGNDFVTDTYAEEQSVDAGKESSEKSEMRNPYPIKINGITDGVTGELSDGNKTAEVDNVNGITLSNDEKKNIPIYKGDSISGEIKGLDADNIITIRLIKKSATSGATLNDNDTVTLAEGLSGEGGSFDLILGKVAKRDAGNIELTKAEYYKIKPVDADYSTVKDAEFRKILHEFGYNVGEYTQDGTDKIDLTKYNLVITATPIEGTEAGKTLIYAKSINLSEEKYGIIRDKSYGVESLFHRDEVYVGRISGKNREDTSIKISKVLYPEGTRVALVANGDVYPDVLTAMPYSRLLEAPILYVGKDNVSRNTIREFERLHVEKVIIVGGENTVSQNSERIINRSGYPTDRIYGADRYETSLKIAEKVKQGSVKENKDVIIADGKNFADALSISPFAMKNDIPILLTHPFKESPYTVKGLEEFSKGKIYIVGGNSSVSQSLENEYSRYAKDGVTRFAGNDRYETAKLIMEKTDPLANIAIYASGQQFPDALVSAQLANYENAPIMLLKRDRIPDVLENYIKNSKIRGGIVVGGERAVSENVVDRLKTIKK